MPKQSKAQKMEPQATESEKPVMVRDLVAAYSGTVILDQLSFDVERGEVFVILGGSGSGKSTLLKHIIGLYKPQSGSIRIEGEELVDSSTATRERLLQRIGVMYQSGALFGSMSVLENVALPMREYTQLPPQAIERIARMKLQLVGLEAAAHKSPSELSGGMKKRAAIARAMALDPAILFLDEPSAGLDPITSAELDQLILSLRESLGITFVIVTHELESIFTIADRVIMLDKRTRKIGAMGNPHDLARDTKDPWIRSFFRRTTAPAG